MKSSGGGDAEEFGALVKSGVCDLIVVLVFADEAEKRRSISEIGEEQATDEIVVFLVVEAARAVEIFLLKRDRL